jgi:hypothetical protein
VRSAGNTAELGAKVLCDGIVRLQCGQLEFTEIRPWFSAGFSRFWRCARARTAKRLKPFGVKQKGLRALVFIREKGSIDGSQLFTNRYRGRPNPTELGNTSQNCARPTARHSERVRILIRDEPVEEQAGLQDH